MQYSILKYLSISAVLLSLTACVDSNNNRTGAGAPHTTVSGIAATGVAISGGTVSLSCGGGFGISTTTDSMGHWSAAVPGSALPCYVKVYGGTPAGTFYSVAQTPSGTATTTTANITPLTDLATAAAVNAAGGPDALDVWFANDSPALRQQVADGIAAAVAQLRMALNAAGYELPAGAFDPFTAAIVAGGAGDLYDQILEAYKAALAAASSNYNDARDDYLSGANLPEADGGDPVDPPDTTLTASESGVRFATTGTVLGTAESNKLRYWPGPGSVSVGSKPGLLNEVTVFGPDGNTSYVNFRNIPDAAGSYDCGYSVNEQLANVEIGFAVSNGYNTAGTRTGAGSFTPGFRCSLTITKVGTRNGSNYTGTIEGSFDAQLYKTGQSTGTQGSISVTGHFRIGMPTNVEPATPSASISLFGKSLKSLYVGNYTLKCAPSPGQAVETFTFSIAADGGSTFNGAALVDSAHPGLITSAGSPSSDSMTLSINAKTGDQNYVVLGFTSDGKFQPNSVNIKSGSTSRTLMCYFTTGNVAPATTSGAVADLRNVVAAQARSETLDCRKATESSSVKTPTSFTISSDGSAQIADLNFAAKDLTEMKDAILFADVAASPATKTGSISYGVIEGGQVSRTLAVSFGSDLKTTGVLYSSGSVLDPANTHTCQPQ